MAGVRELPCLGRRSAGRMDWKALPNLRRDSHRISHRRLDLRRNRGGVGRKKERCAAPRHDIQELASAISDFKRIVLSSELRHRDWITKPNEFVEKMAVEL
jgi:hypothetical protein